MISPLSAIDPYGTSLEERLTAASMVLDRSFRHGIVEVPDYEIRIASVRGSPLVVEVQRGDCRPYATAPGREIFVRRGASCLRPEPHGELAAMFRGADRQPRGGLRACGAWRPPIVQAIEIATRVENSVDLVSRICVVRPTGS